MSQNRAATRDELLASHHYQEMKKIDDPLQSNTELTAKVHELAQQSHRFTERLAPDGE